MIIDKENYYFIAPDNKNGLSVRPPRDLYLADKFEFKVNFTIDFEKCQGESSGIVMMNGKHLGIHLWNKKLNGSVWTEDGVFDTYQNISDKNVECRFICDNKNKQISLIIGDEKDIRTAVLKDELKFWTQRVKNDDKVFWEIRDRLKKRIEELEK